MEGEYTKQTSRLLFYTLPRALPFSSCLVSVQTSYLVISILIGLVFCLCRRMRGGRRLWPSRDESKWGHDKYDEMNTQEKQYDVVISLLFIFFFFDIFPLAVSIHF